MANLSGEAADHLTRRTYDDRLEALTDLDRVLGSFDDLAATQTVITHDELTFLVRRAKVLLAACLDDARLNEAGRS